MFKEEFMKKRTIKLLSLTLVVLMTFFAVGCDMEAIFAPLSEIQTNVPDGTGDLIDDTELVSGVAALLRPIEEFFGMNYIIGIILLVQCSGFVFKTVLYPNFIKRKS